MTSIRRHLTLRLVVATSLLGACGVLSAYVYLRNELRLDPMGAAAFCRANRNKWVRTRSNGFQPLAVLCRRVLALWSVEDFWACSRTSLLESAAAV